jgi:hypothetical protein
VIKDSTEALRIDPTYTKALVRRAQAYEATDKLADALKGTDALLFLVLHLLALASSPSPSPSPSPSSSSSGANVAIMLMVMPRRSDFEAALALDGSIRQAREGKQRLPAAIAEQQQREQEKMLGAYSVHTRIPSQCSL